MRKFTASYGGGICLMSTVDADIIHSIENSIVWGNIPLAAYIGENIYVGSYADLNASYCDYGSSDGVASVVGNISVDPKFASSSSDYHLKSVGGHYDVSTGAYIPDTLTSLCIDAGDPASVYSNEPSPNGGRVNMGYYGNTTQASKSDTSPPAKATNPIPNDKSENNSTSSVLEWTPGTGATSHRVYFGTDSSPDSGEFKIEQSTTAYAPGQLNSSTTYYWRIDEVNQYGTTSGDVWEFGTGSRMIYVDDVATNGNGTLASPYNRIQSGINAASSGDTVIVRNGTYYGTNNKDLYLNSSVITVKSENGPFSCTIDCQNSGRGFLLNNSGASNSIINGFTIKDGNTSNGGGIYISGTNPIVANCIVRDNNAGSYGGGVYISSSQAYTKLVTL